MRSRGASPGALCLQVNQPFSGRGDLDIRVQQLYHIEGLVQLWLSARARADGYCHMLPQEANTNQGWLEDVYSWPAGPHAYKCEK